MLDEDGSKGDVPMDNVVMMEIADVKKITKKVNRSIYKSLPPCLSLSQLTPLLHNLPQCREYLSTPSSPHLHTHTYTQQ